MVLLQMCTRLKNNQRTFRKELAFSSIKHNMGKHVRLTALFVSYYILHSSNVIADSAISAPGHGKSCRWSQLRWQYIFNWYYGKNPIHRGIVGKRHNCCSLFISWCLYKFKKYVYIYIFYLIFYVRVV